MRNAWRTAWARHLGRLPLEPLQAQMTEVIAVHPEYHAHLTDSPGLTSCIQKDGDSAGRVFLHLGLHLALREQLNTDRPQGIAQVYRRLSAAQRDRHEAEHRMIDVLERTLWEAQSTGRPPDQVQYLEALRRL